jgi:hypothetical protein
LEYYNPSGGTDSLSVTSGTTVLTAGAVGGGIDERSLSSLNISSGAEVYVQPVQENHSDRQVLVVPGSGLTVTGSLDMTNNDMIVTSGNWGTINGKIGANGGPHGIYTDQDSNDNIYTTMGVMPNNGGSGTTAIYSTFDGISVSYSAILVKWTYGADANLDGSVNTTDYDRLVNGYDNSLTGWYNGDFNYDGVINGSDFTIYDNCEGATGL